MQIVANKYTNVCKGSVGYHGKNMEDKIMNTVINVFSGLDSSISIENHAITKIPQTIELLINNPNSSSLTNSKNIISSI